MQSPTNNLTITLVQTELIWERAQANCEQLDDLLTQQTMNTDLIVLPETFNTAE